MIDTVLNLLFRCAHRRLSRPITPRNVGEISSFETYVVCLECGKQFAYNWADGRTLKDDRHAAAVQPG